jgi:hypothetical protein
MEQQTSLATGPPPAPQIPEALQRLPVAKQIGEIDFTRRFILARAQTGSGKTTILPAYEALLRKSQGKKGCVAVRVPTKTVAGFTVPFIRREWDSLGIKVGNLNRDVAKGSKEEKLCATADVVFISDGSLNRLRQLQPVGALVVDEAHYMTNVNAELDLASAKRDGMDIRLMSATVDPQMFLDYLPGCAHYVLEGRVYPVRTHTIWASEKVFDRNDHAELFDILQKAVVRAKAASDGFLVFLPTKQMTETVAKHFADQLPTTFIHGSVNPADAEKWTREQAGKAFMATATTAAATGVTIDVGCVYICDERVESVVERGIERMSTEHLDGNGLLQMKGRAGRLREGDAYLITHEGARDRRRGEDPWEFVVPEPIVPPAQKATPFEVVLSMAQHGITSNDGIDLLSKLDLGELAHAREWLVQNHCLRPDGTMTHMGRYVAAFPLPTQYAHLVLSGRCRKCARGDYVEESRCPQCVRVRLTLLAAFCLGLEGVYGLLKVKPRSKQLFAIRADRPEWQLLPPEVVAYGSVPMSLAKLMKCILSRDNLFDWANANNLWARPLFAAKKDFATNAEFILKESAVRAFRAPATDLDSPDLQADVHEHLKRHPLFRYRIIAGATDRRSRPNGIFDSCFSDLFGLETHNYRPWDCWSIPKKVKTGNFEFIALEMGFLEPNGPQPFDGWAPPVMPLAPPAAEGPAAAPAPAPAPATAQRAAAAEAADDYTPEDTCATCKNAVTDCECPTPIDTEMQK